MNAFFRVLLGIVILSAAIPSLAQKPIEKDEDWLIVPGKGFGPITAACSKEDLVKRFGQDNVKTEEIWVGDGETEPGTVVFPDDPTRRVEILWDEEGGRLLGMRIQIHGDKSLWHTREGVSLGTTLRELEKINGKPFKLHGFGWDYSGGVHSWEGGTLGRAFTPEGKWLLDVRLSPPDWDRIWALSEEEKNVVIGEGGDRSDHPVMEKLNPSVYWISTDIDAGKSASSGGGCR